MKTKGIDSADYFKFMTAGSNTAGNNTTTANTTTITRNFNIQNSLFSRKPSELCPLHWTPLCSLSCCYILQNTQYLDII